MPIPSQYCKQCLQYWAKNWVNSRVFSVCIVFTPLSRYDKKYARICCCCPLYHTFGCVIGNLNALIHGCTMVLPSLSFDPQASIQAIVDEKCTSVYGTPTMFIDLLDVARQSKPDLSSVHTGIMAGATCPEELCRYSVTNILQNFLMITIKGMLSTS